jgi:hypothetical protein
MDPRIALKLPKWFLFGPRFVGCLFVAFCFLFGFLASWGLCIFFAAWFLRCPFVAFCIPVAWLFSAAHPVLARPAHAFGVNNSSLSWFRVQSFVFWKQVCLVSQVAMSSTYQHAKSTGHAQSKSTSPGSTPILTVRMFLFSYIYMYVYMCIDICVE